MSTFQSLSQIIFFEKCSELSAVNEITPTWIRSVTDFAFIEKSKKKQLIKLYVYNKYGKQTNK